MSGVAGVAVQVSDDDGADECRSGNYVHGDGLRVPLARLARTASHQQAGVDPRGSRLARVLTLLLGTTLLGPLAGCGSTHRATPASASATGPAAHPASPAAAAAQARDTRAAQSRAATLPSGVLAMVAGRPITLAAFDRLHARLAAGAGQAVPLDPPRFSRCITALRAQQARVRAGLHALARAAGKHPAPTAQSAALDRTPALLAQCRTRQAQLAADAVQQLIESRWIEDEASSAHVSVSASEVSTALAGEHAARPHPLSASSPAAFSASPEPVRREDLRLALLLRKLSQRWDAGAGRVSEAQVTSFFDSHQALFAPASRNGGPGRPQLAAVRDRVRAMLQAQLLSRRAGEAASTAQRALRARTFCRPGYVVALCANAGAAR